jgi:phosphate starvation-inducible membrane PsiE
MQKFYIVYLAQIVTVLIITSFVTYVYYQFKKEVKYHFIIGGVILYLLYLLFIRLANYYLQ